MYWTIASIECYKRGCKCKGCFYKRYEGCNCKKTVIKLVKNIGIPNKKNTITEINIDYIFDRRIQKIRRLKNV